MDRRCQRSVSDLNRPVIIAVIAMWMMQMSVDQVVDVVAMWHLFMSAIGAMDMVLVVPAAGMIRGATIRVGCVDLKNMDFDLVAVHVMKMTVVQVVGMPVMGNRYMTAARTMLVGMSLDRFSVHGAPHREE
jgi:hypothetical protein